MWGCGYKGQYNVTQSVESDMQCVRVCSKVLELIGDVWSSVCEVILWHLLIIELLDLMIQVGNSGVCPLEEFHDGDSWWRRWRWLWWARWGWNNIHGSGFKWGLRLINGFVSPVWQKGRWHVDCQWQKVGHICVHHQVKNKVVGLLWSLWGGWDSWWFDCLFCHLRRDWIIGGEKLKGRSNMGTYTPTPEISNPLKFPIRKLVPKATFHGCTDGFCGNLNSL